MPLPAGPSGRQAVGQLGSWARNQAALVRPGARPGHSSSTRPICCQPCLRTAQLTLTKHDEGVVRVSLTADDDGGTGRGVDLWINPDNLYVVGFSPQAAPGVSYVFNDIFASAPIPGVRRLPFGGNYVSLARTAQRDRSTTPVSFDSVRRAVVDLANQRSADQDPRTTARALMLLLQFTSEAVRFNDVEGVFRNVLNDRGSSGSGIPSWVQQLENNWDALSNFYWNEMGVGPNPRPAPLRIGGTTVNNAHDVLRYARTLLPPVVGTSFKPGHDEL
ncbi:ribosome-inactivating family protein [Kitasatospora sp. NPDC088779]|uniref:ribosome-inactivating family protein n=1 Tax=Kitasatospora sp. NPDC088779 TaxID=3154964 RepID=UPI0034443441